MSESESPEPEIIRAAADNLRNERENAEAAFFRELKEQCVRTQQFQQILDQYVRDTENHLTRLRVLVAGNLGGLISGVESYFVQRGEDSHGGDGGAEEV
jgi:very-short-patch-repair endonuclease